MEVLSGRPTCRPSIRKLDGGRRKEPAGLPGGRNTSPRKRELIEPNLGDKRYIRRDGQGRFTTDQVDVERSLSVDRRQHLKTPAKPGQGDRGDRPKKKG